MCQVECVTFGAPMVGDQDLCDKVQQLGWASDITNIVSRHDIVPRLLLAPWKAGKIAGMSKFLMLLGAPARISDKAVVCMRFCCTNVKPAQRRKVLAAAAVRGGLRRRTIAE